MIETKIPSKAAHLNGDVVNEVIPSIDKLTNFP